MVFSSQNHMSDSGKVRVRFVTRHKKYTVPETPFAVPLTIAKSGLSKVVNHLLGNSEDVIGFEFLVCENLLRSSLLKILEKLSLSLEDVIEIEYFPSVTFNNDKMPPYEAPAWTSAVSSGLNNNILVVGCYDGNIKVLDAKDNLKEVCAAKSHEAPIHDITASFIDSHPLIFSCGVDHRVKCFLLKSESTRNSAHMSTRLLAEFQGHSSSVNCVDVAVAEKSMLFTGDWNGSVLGFELAEVLEGAKNSENQLVSSKKQKNSASKSSVTAAPSITVTSSLNLPAHSQAISDIKCIFSGGSFASQLLTASWDHAVKLWDVEKQDNIHTINTGKVVTSISIRNNSVLSSHTDSKIRLWDIRGSAEAIPGIYTRKSKTPGVSLFIAQVMWHPLNEYLFASIDYEGDVCVWDTRSKSSPILSVESHEGKGLCMSWSTISKEIGIFSGGSDCCVKFNSIAAEDSI